MVENWCLDLQIIWGNYNKKKGLVVSRQSILTNLKSNTMKTGAKLRLFVIPAKLLCEKIASQTKKDEYKEKFCILIQFAAPNPSNIRLPGGKC